MELIVEDGTIVEGANSYNSVEDIRLYAEYRGVKVPDADDVLIPLAIKAMDYIESFRNRYGGTKIESDQITQFPRDGLYIDGILIGSDIIPTEVKNAQSQLIIEQVNGLSITTSNNGRVIIEKTIGPITTKYADSSVSGNGSVRMDAVDNLLRPLFKNSYGSLNVDRG